ncbi:MAG: WYL domain-containing protein, partial [Brooklawnia sp.]
MTTAMSKVRRLLALVPYLQAHRGIPVAEVTRTFGITEPQLIDDLKKLWMCGLPGGLPDDLIEIDMDA